MFKKRIILVLALIVTSYFTAGHFIFHITNKSRSNYRKMLETLKPEAVEHYGSTKRDLVTKDLWINHKDSFYHYIIVSEGSILHLNQERSSNTKVQEQMSNMTCYLQQKKYYIDQNGQECLDHSQAIAMQQVCVLKIKEGRYDFSLKDFVGTDAKMNIYQLAGHDLSPNISLDKATIVLDGICDHVHFFFKDDQSHLQTTNLKATLFTEKEIL